MSDPCNVVIVGGGQAGCRAAEALRGLSSEVSITLIGEETHLPYERPPLSKGLLSGESGAEKARIKPPEFFEASRIDLRLGRRAVGLDPTRRLLTLAGGETLGFTKLLLATGSRPRRLGAPGTNLKGVHLLRTIDDAERLRDDLGRCRRLVVVGAGFLGLEVAACARERFGCEVTVLESAGSILRRGAPEEMRAAIEDLHTSNGVDIRCHAQVDYFEGNGRLERVVCAGGEALAADCAVVAIGVEPNTELARNAGLAVRDGIVVNEFCETSSEGIFAAGEVTNHWNRSLARAVRLESWQVAQTQAIAAARSICGLREPYEEVPWFWTDQYGHNFQLIGSFQPDARATRRTYEGQLRFTSFYCLDELVVGALAVNSGKDIRTARDLMRRQIQVSAAELSDPSNKLRKLLAQEKSVRASGKTARPK